MIVEDYYRMTHNLELSKYAPKGPPPTLDDYRRVIATINRQVKQPEQ